MIHILWSIAILLATCCHSESLTVNPQDFFGGVDTEAYLDWVNDNGGNYEHAHFMRSASGPEDGAAVHWKIDDNDIHLAVAVRATGWVGFGIAEAGGMLGADVVLFEAKNPDTIMDRHILDVRFPIEDDSQDWNIVDSRSEGGFLIFEATRLLDTNDPQDRAIIFDADPIIPPTRIIAAWGNDADFQYHGQKRARSSIRFYGTGQLTEETFLQQMEEHSEGSFLVTAQDYVIPAVETEYAYFCFSRNDIIAQGVPDVDRLYAIGIEPLVDEDATAHVHHFVLYGNSEANNTLADGTCYDINFAEMAYVWAPGEGSFATPDDVAVPLFGEDGFQSYTLEIHYNNPELISGVMDSSGIRMYYTSEPRQYEMGVLILGDPTVILEGTSVGPGVSQHIFGCPSSCSSEVLEEPVTVIREYLHMHKTGVRIFNEQVRDGEVLRNGLVDYWEFDQQGNQGVQQQPFEVLPGDEFRTSCYYEGKDDTTFGWSSQEEMCMAFLFYYPRQKIVVEEGLSFPWVCGYQLGYEPCAADYETTEIDLSSNGLERTFGFLDEVTDGAEEGADGAVDAGTAGSGSSSLKGALTVMLVGLISMLATVSMLL